MTGLGKRIRKLEGHVLKRPEWGSSKIALTEENEVALYEQCRKIVEAGLQLEELAPEQLRLMEEMSHLCWFRAIDIFSSVVGQLIHRDNAIAKLFWHTRLLWFVQEVRQACWQFIEEQRIYDQPDKSWKQKKKDADEFYRKHWKKVFTKESYDKIWRSTTKKTCKSV